MVGQHRPESPIGHDVVGGLLYDELPTKLKNQLKKYTLTVAIVENATSQEIRTLFGRLQEGTKLNPAEKRNAILSKTGDHIDAFVFNHKFFKDCRILENRYNRQDYLAHVFSLLFYDNKHDLKADILEKLYLDSSIVIDAEFLKKVDEILDFMNHIDKNSKTRITNKFSFIDLFWFLYNERNNYNKINFVGFGEEFDKFDTDRLKHKPNPKKLIDKVKPTKRDQNLYDYILAFEFYGSATTNIETRARVIKSMFKKHFI